MPTKKKKKWYRVEVVHREHADHHGFYAAYILKATCPEDAASDGLDRATRDVKAMSLGIPDRIARVSEIQLFELDLPTTRSLGIREVSADG